MKIYSFLLVFILLTACTSNTNELNSKKNEKTWKLVKMTGSFVGSETVGSAMEYQEEIRLKSNHTFTKTRIENGNTQTASGIYKYLKLEDGNYLELTYPSKSVLIGNCFGDLKETYWVVSNDRLSGTWHACDGPGLEYELN